MTKNIQSALYKSCERISKIKSFLSWNFQKPKPEQKKSPLFHHDSICVGHELCQEQNFNSQTRLPSVGIHGREKRRGRRQTTSVLLVLLCLFVCFVFF